MTGANYTGKQQKKSETQRKVWNDRYLNTFSGNIQYVQNNKGHSLRSFAVLTACRQRCAMAIGRAGFKAGLLGGKTMAGVSSQNNTGTAEQKQAIESEKTINIGVCAPCVSCINALGIGAAPISGGRRSRKSGDVFGK